MTPFGSRRPGAPAARPRRPAALRPGTGRVGAVRRTRPVRRASAGLTPTRAAALLALLAAVAGVYGAASSEAFAARRTEISGTTWTADDAVLSALALPAGQNLFVLQTQPLAGRLGELPSVLSASVSVALPDEVRVAVRERVALLAWSVDGRRFLVDETGFLFGVLPDELPEGTAPLPEVEDRRAASAGLAVASTLDAVDLDAALRLGSLTPADVGSAAARLTIRVDDDQGFVVRAEPAGWTAVFGFYTPTLRTAELIPGQVRLLRSLLVGREATVLRVILADDRSGTYVPRPTPSPSATPRP